MSNGKRNIEYKNHDPLEIWLWLDVEVNTKMAERDEEGAFFASKAATAVLEYCNYEKRQKGMLKR